MEKEKIITLVRAVQQGDEQAFSELYNAVQPELYYYISKTLDDPGMAEDVLQETFIEMWNTIGQLKEPGAFTVWSRKIAYHRCTAHFRKRRELTLGTDEDGHSLMDTIEEDRTEFIPDEALDKEDLKQTIQAMLAELPMEQRSAIMLRYFDEISVKDIAEIQGVSEGTVKSRLNYGRKALQKSVEDYEKKNGVKLHCAGAIPLLLWLFANEASAVSAAASTASVAAGTAAPVVAEGVKAGTKAAGKFAIKKLIAGIAAAAVVAGGATTAVLLHNDPEPPKESFPIVWCGDGDVSYCFDRHFELTVEEMDDTYISGYLEVSNEDKTTHESAFEGTGAVTENTVVYTITYEIPVTVGVIPKYTYEQMELIYNKETDDFSFDFVYRVTMEREK